MRKERKKKKDGAIYNIKEDSPKLYQPALKILCLEISTKPEFAYIRRKLLIHGYHPDHLLPLTLQDA